MYETIEQLQLRLGITGNTEIELLTRLRSAAIDKVHKAHQRDFLQTTHEEIHAAAGWAIVLQHHPVVGVLSLRVDCNGEFPESAELDPGVYRLDRERGIIHANRSPFMVARRVGGADESWTWARVPQSVRVVYSVPAEIPWAIQEAVILEVARLYRQVQTMRAQGYRDVIQERAGDAFLTFASPGLAEGYQAEREPRI